MRIGGVTKYNYTEYLKLLGVKNSSFLDTILEKDEAERLLKKWAYLTLIIPFLTIESL